MMLWPLLLIFIPVAAWEWAKRYHPSHLWLITGATFGAVIDPFCTVLGMIGLSLGFPVGTIVFLITLPVTFFHTGPGYKIFALVAGHRPHGDNEQLLVYGLIAVMLGAACGTIGWFIDRYPERNSNKLLVLLIAVPMLYWVFAPSIEGTIWKKHEPFGAVCFQVMDASPNAQVWVDIGSPPKIQLNRFGSVPLGSKQFCSNYGLSMNPIQIQVYSATDANSKGSHATIEDAPSEPLTVPITADEKRCVGIFPDSSTSPTKWTTRIIDCALTHHSSGPAKAGR